MIVLFFTLLGISVILTSYNAFTIVTNTYSDKFIPVYNKNLIKNKIKRQNRVQSLNVRNIISDQLNTHDSIEVEVMAMRASEIKKILVGIKADTRGLYDKAELGKLLIKLELDSLAYRLVSILNVIFIISILY